MEPVSTTILQGATSGFLGNLASKAVEKLVENQILPHVNYPPVDRSVRVKVQILNIHAPPPEDAVCGAIHHVRFAMGSMYAKRRARRGMTIKVDLSLCGLARVDCGLAAYFSFWDGPFLEDLNDSYCSYDGKVSVGAELRPSRREQFFPNIALFMPTAELHLDSGTHDLALFLRAYRRASNETLDQTETFRWQFTQL